MRHATHVALASLALLAGCAYPNPEHVRMLNTLVGKSETEVVRAQGVPTRTYETGGLKFLSYDMRHIESIPGAGFGYGGFGPYGYGGFGYGGFGYGGVGYDGFGGFGPEIIQRDCDTTFELKASVVQSWKLRGNDC